MRAAAATTAFTGAPMAAGHLLQAVEEVFALDVAVLGVHSEDRRHIEED